MLLLFLKTKNTTKQKIPQVSFYFFSFPIRYDDPTLALSAIRNLDGFELNGRKIRVSYTNTSGLKDIAKALGHEVHEFPGEQHDISDQSNAQQVTVKSVIKGLTVYEAHDLLVAMKAYINEDRGIRAKQLFKEFPQLTTAFSEIQMMLGMGLGLTQADLNPSMYLASKYFGII